MKVANSYNFLSLLDRSMTYFKDDEERQLYYRDKKNKVLNIRVNDEHLASLDYVCEYFSHMYGYRFNRSMTVRKLIENEYFMRKFQRFR